MKTITEIKNEFASASLEEKKALCQLYAEDERSGVRKLIEKCRKEEAALEKELLRMEHMMEYEHAVLPKWEGDLLQALWLPAL